MKKVLSAFPLFTIFYLLFTIPAIAACTPPTDYSSCPELNPDLNLDIIGYEPISGNLGLIDFSHPTDSKAPQLSTLVEGNLAPSVTSLYQISGAQKPGDAPDDFATLVGFSTYSGQAILVPNSGYDIGGGYEVVVIHATNNSLTLKYTPDDNITIGYTLYLQNFQVDSSLLAYYNQLNQAGRDELPALMAGMKIGQAIGNEILVAIRDTGMFLDPRWLNDWWQNLPAEIRELILKAMSLQVPFFSLACNPSLPGDRDSRPYYNYNCDLCNQTNKMTPACAESFSVNDAVSYRRNEGTLCEDKYWVEKNWKGTITVDPSQTTIPFVGKKGQEDEQKYLTDYLTGTNEYYKNYGLQLNMVNFAGVLRKLEPMGYQDQLKNQMVNRAIKSQTGSLREGGIHDYKVRYARRVCLPEPAWWMYIYNAGLSYLTGIDILNNLPRCIFFNFSSAPIIGGLIPSQISFEEKPLSKFVGHFPPNPNEKDYAEKWEKWKKSEWGRLWEAVPIFSQEDTPGRIGPYLGSRPKDQFQIQNPKDQIEKVPHLARLYETSGTIQKTLLPAKSKQVLGEKTYLAETTPPSNPGFEASGSCSKSGNTYTVNAVVSLTNAPGLSDISIHVGSEYWHTCPNSDACTNLVAPPYGVTGKPGDILSSPSFNFRSDVVVPNFIFSATYSIKLTADGCEFVGGPPKPPGPTCGLPEPKPVNACQKTAITDSNPNDDLCCEPIKIALSATDQFVNTRYIECGKEVRCDTDPAGKKINCHDPCEDGETQGVSRQVGVALSHPYLETIWNQTGNTLSGVFNIFRPYGVPKFPKLDAAASINYSYSPGSASPTTGKFYFPFLGGVKIGKDQTIKTLTPYGRK